VFGGQLDARATFTTEDLATLAAISGFASSGAAVASGTITIPYIKRAQMGGFAGSGNVSISGANGLLVPTSFNLPSSGNATAALECYLLSSDGVTEPVAFNTGVTPSAQAFVGDFACGPVAVNGTTIGELTNAVVTPGIPVETKFYGGQNYLTPAGVRIAGDLIKPVVEITTDDLSVLSALGACYGVATSVVVFARARSGKSFVADETASHVKFTLTDGLILPQNITGSGSGTASRTLRIWGETLTMAGSQAIA
jgi:hypothetical protein